jgi:polar amino acid transport system substrate-binding protein
MAISALSRRMPAPLELALYRSAAPVHHRAGPHRGGALDKDGDTMVASAPAESILELAPSGTLRVAINYGNPILAQRDEATGQPSGISADLARELGRRLGVPVAFVTFDAAIKVSDALRQGLWDVAFLAIDPGRAEEIAFTAPYVIIEGTYMVPEASPLKDVGDVDRDGIRVSAGKGSAYDLFLTRTLKHAQIVRAPTSPAAIETFVAQKLDAAAGVRQPLVLFADSHAGYRVMDGRFMAIEQAMGTPKGRPAGLAFLYAFVEDMKASGFVAKALDRSGQVDAVVAPPAKGSR